MFDAHFADTKTDKRERNDTLELNRIDCVMEKGTRHSQRSLKRTEDGTAINQVQT
jgi:hypothetical protein